MMKISYRIFLTLLIWCQDVCLTNHLGNTNIFLALIINNCTNFNQMLVSNISHFVNMVSLPVECHFNSQTHSHTDLLILSLLLCHGKANANLKNTSYFAWVHPMIWTLNFKTSVNPYPLSSPSLYFSIPPLNHPFCPPPTPISYFLPIWFQLPNSPLSSGFTYHRFYSLKSSTSTTCAVTYHLPASTCTFTLPAPQLAPSTFFSYLFPPTISSFWPEWMNE